MISSSGEAVVGLGDVEAWGDVAAVRESFVPVVGLPGVQADASTSAGRRIQTARGPMEAV
jgi:hypothetical protein